MGCYNSTIINASSEKIWATIKDFHALSWASQVVTKSEKVGDIPGTDVGAKRILNDAFHETLLSVDEADKSFTYSIDDGPEVLAKDKVNALPETNPIEGRRAL